MFRARRRVIDEQVPKPTCSMQSNHREPLAQIQRFFCFSAKHAPGSFPVVAGLPVAPNINDGAPRILPWQLTLFVSVLERLAPVVAGELSVKRRACMCLMQCGGIERFHADR